MRLFLLCFLSFLSIEIFAQAPAIQWAKTYGGNKADNVEGIAATSDGGSVFVGYTQSTNGDVTASYGGWDIWVVKVSSTGCIEWQRSYGGSADEKAFAVQQTTDGGYIVGGTTKSENGDVTGWHKGVQLGLNTTDCWVIKLSSTGNIEWQKCYGGTLVETLFSIQQTSDGGYVFTGQTDSYDGDVQGYHPSATLDYTYDVWTVKLNSAGTIQWQKCLGGNLDEIGRSIEQTTDGGYIIAGYASSNGGDVSGLHNSSTDAWVVKLDPGGNMQWQKCLGGSSGDVSYSIKVTPDGGYIVAGLAGSADGDLSGTLKLGSCWVIKLHATGNIDWQKTFGGGTLAETIELTPDGGFVIAANSSYLTPQPMGHHGNADLWVIKIDVAGKLEWQKYLGGSEYEIFPDVIITTDGAILVSGTTTSTNGDVSNLHGIVDCFLVKLGSVITLNLGPDTTLCPGNTILLHAKKGFKTYKWQDGSTDSIYTVTTPGTYFVAAGDDCGSNFYDTIIVSPSPPIAFDIGSDLTICNGDTVSLTATPGFLNYVWTPAYNINAASAQTVKVFPSADTMYKVKAEKTPGCFAYDSVKIKVHTSPKIDLGPDKSLCAGDSLVLNAGIFNSYLWNTGSTSPTITVNTKGMYSVIVTDNNNCKGIDTTKILNIFPAPSHFLPADTAVCSYGSVQLSAKTTFSKYLWNTNSGAPSINITQPGVYWLQVTDNNNCSGRDSIIISQKDCMKGFYIPNAFSPNRDGKNDYFKPMLFGHVKMYAFTVFNQWGEVVFKTTDINKGWDGDYKSVRQNENVFVWVCKYQFENEPVKIEKGTVTPVR